MSTEQQLAAIETGRETVRVLGARLAVFKELVREWEADVKMLEMQLAQAARYAKPDPFEYTVEEGIQGWQEQNDIPGPDQDEVWALDEEELEEGEIPEHLVRSTIAMLAL